MAQHQPPAGQLTAQKTASVVDSHKFKISGFVLYNEATNSRCIIEMSAVRWLKNEEMWWLMHTSANLGVPDLDKINIEAK